MKTNEYGINLIKELEGLRFKAYLCQAGVYTIGYGTTFYPTVKKPVKKGDEINLYQANLYFKMDLEKFETQVSKYIKVPLNCNQFSALVSFSYNVGLGAFGKSTLLKLVNANPNDKKIRDEFGKWVNAGGKKSDGLIKRRKLEADLYFKK